MGFAAFLNLRQSRRSKSSEVHGWAEIDDVVYHVVLQQDGTIYLASSKLAQKGEFLAAALKYATENKLFGYAKKNLLARKSLSINKKKVCFQEVMRRGNFVAYTNIGEVEITAPATEMEFPLSYALAYAKLAA